MSANARDAPLRCGSTRQLSSSGVDEPVLQVAAVDEAHGADPARRDPGPGLEHHRVVAVDERHGGDAVRGVRGGEDPLGLGGGRRERLLADDVLAGRERRRRQRGVQVVRRADVDDVDAVRGHRLLGRAVGVRHAEAGGRLARALGARRGHADDLGPGQARGAHVDGADEAGRADDRGAQPRAGGGQDGTPSSAFFASTSMPCRRARFSPRILRLACSVSGG